MAGFLKAQVEPRALVLGLAFPAHFLYFVISAYRAAYDTIGPAHLLDVSKTLLFSGKLYVDVPDINRLRLDSLWHEPTLRQLAVCVK